MRETRQHFIELESMLVVSNSAMYEFANPVQTGRLKPFGTQSWNCEPSIVDIVLENSMLVVLYLSIGFV